MKHLKLSLKLCSVLFCALFLYIFPVKADNIQVDFHRFTYDNKYETALLKAYNEAGDEIWSYQCGSYLLTELNRIGYIDIYDNKVYFFEDGDIVALDLETGNEIWRNDEFIGSESAHVFSSTGKLYICGYYGPDLFVVDRNGNTVAREEKLTDLKSWWPVKMEFLHDDIMRITYEGGDPYIDFDVKDYFYKNISDSYGNMLDATGTFTDKQVQALKKDLNIPDELYVTCVVDADNPSYWEGTGLTIVWVEFLAGDQGIASCFADLSTGKAVKTIDPYTPGTGGRP